MKAKTDKKNKKKENENEYEEPILRYLNFHRQCRRRQYENFILMLNAFVFFDRIRQRKIKLNYYYLGKFNNIIETSAARAHKKASTPFRSVSCRSISK